MPSVFVGCDPKSGAIRTTCLDLSGNEGFTVNMLREWTKGGLEIRCLNWAEWQDFCGKESITMGNQKSEGRQT